MLKKFSFNIGEQQFTLNENDVRAIFHYMYYESGVSDKTYWFGHKISKCPLDLWMYQEIINESKPDLIIQTGTGEGGSALYLAHMLDIMGRGKVVSIDSKSNSKRPKHDRIVYVKGSPKSLKTEDKVLDIIEQNEAENIMVIIGSDTSCEHVLAEMELWWTYVNIGSYLVVENCHLNGHPVCPEHGDGPMEATVRFLKNNVRFSCDDNAHKFFMSYNLNGYLKRIR